MSDATNPSPEHDGIQEEDNVLPRWWLATLFGAMVFALGYWEYFHVYHLGELPLEHYQAEQARKEGIKSDSDVTDESLLAMSKGPSATKGGATFATTCVVCHGAKGEGRIGPNLTDNYWLHGGKPTDIYKTISNGWVMKGMPAWKPTLGPAKVQELTAYIVSLRNTNVPGRAPEGQEYKSEAAAAPHAELDAPKPILAATVAPTP